MKAHGGAWKPRVGAAHRMVVLPLSVSIVRKYWVRFSLIGKMNRSTGISNHVFKWLQITKLG